MRVVMVVPPRLFFFALLPLLLRLADLDVVDFLLFDDADDLDFEVAVRPRALPPPPPLRFADVDFFDIDFFAPPPPPPPLFFFPPPLLLPARLFAPADFAMKPPSGDVGDTP